MTGAGRRFRPHATALLRVWQQSRQEVALAPDYEAVLAVGAQYSLWDGLLLRWMGQMREVVPAFALRAEVAQPEELMRQLAEGLLDIGVMYAAQTRPGMEIEHLIDETLIMVSNAPKRRRDLGADYIYVDWGPDFRVEHSVANAGNEAPGLVVGLGAIGLQYILENGGTGYFPERHVRSHLAGGRLHRVRGAPRFLRPAYLVYRPRPQDDAFSRALELLRATASDQGLTPKR